MLKAIVFQNPIVLIALFIAAMFNLNSNPRLFVELVIAMFGYLFVMLSANNTFFENVGMLLVGFVLLMYVIA
ncbi:MAG: hypothetical protein J6B49_00865 [Phascolarctobacterium sp.]|nr:hypothetical protein [Phascolarctobacterium sp.]